MLRYSTLTILALVVLRMAIGWHFFAEGWQKVDSQWVLKHTYVDGEFPWVHIPERDESQVNTPFSAKGYFQNAPGPFVDYVRPQLIEDQDERVLALFDVKDIPKDADQATLPLDKLIPEKLEAEWDAYFEEFVKHYKLNETDKKAAQQKLQQAKVKVVEWMTYNPTREDLAEAERKENYVEARRAVPRTVGGQTNDVPISIPNRVAEYEAALTELRGLREKRNVFLTTVDADGEARLRADITQFRNELTEDLEAQNEMMRKMLEDSLPEETERSEVPEPKADEGYLSWMDTVVPWFLFSVGALLLVGFLSRTASLFGGLFLLMAYLAAPPFPWIPQPPATEGNPLYINKTAIEMFALFALATIRSGAWFGLDALFARKAYNEEVALEKGEYEDE